MNSEISDKLTQRMVELDQEQRQQERERERVRDAAEDMLEALKAILGIDNPPVGEPGHIDLQDAFQMGYAAIAKATGDE